MIDDYDSSLVPNPVKFRVVKRMQFQKAQWYNVIVSREVAKWMFSMYEINRDFIGPEPVKYQNYQYRITEPVLVMMGLRWE